MVLLLCVDLSLMTDRCKLVVMLSRSVFILFYFSQVFPVIRHNLSMMCSTSVTLKCICDPFLFFFLACLETDAGTANTNDQKTL